MNTFREASDFYKANPTHPNALDFVRGVQGGYANEIAYNEGIDISSASPSFQEYRVQRNNEGKSGLEKFSQGVAKSGLRTVEGAFQIGKKIADAVNPTTGTADNLLGDKLTNEIETTRDGEKAGVIAGDIAQFAVPGSKVAKVQKGASRLAKAGGQIASDVAVSTVQSGADAGEVATAGAGSAAFSLLGGVGRVAGKIVGRTSKNLASGLSGKSGSAIDAILADPKVARKQIKKLSKGGKEAIVKDMNDRVDVIRKGFDKVRKESSEAFGKGIDDLRANVKVDQKLLNNDLTAMASTYGVTPGASVDDILENSDFLTKPIASRVHKVNQVLQNADTFSGDKVREVFKFLDEKKFKRAGADPEKLGFNAYLKDLSETIQKSLADADTTGTLKEINKNFSNDRQLLEAFESIFGKVKFKNMDEALKASNKFDQLFKQKGLGDDVIDKFFKRIDVDATDFRAEASITDSFFKDTPSNSQGLGIGELIRSITSGVFSPENVSKLSALTGIASNKLQPLLESMTPATRGLFLDTLQDLITGNNQ